LLTAEDGTIQNADGFGSQCDDELVNHVFNGFTLAGRHRDGAVVLTGAEFALNEDVSTCPASTISSYVSIIGDYFLFMERVLPSSDCVELGNREAISKNSVSQGFTSDRTRPSFKAAAALVYAILLRRANRAYAGCCRCPKSRSGCGA